MMSIELSSSLTFRSEYYQRIFPVFSHSFVFKRKKEKNMEGGKNESILLHYRRILWIMMMPPNYLFPIRCHQYAYMFTYGVAQRSFAPLFRPVAISISLSLFFLPLLARRCIYHRKRHHQVSGILVVLLSTAAGTTQALTGGISS